MSSGFSFGNIDVKSKKQSLNLNVQDKVVLLDKSNCEASYNFTPVILADEIYDDVSIKTIDRFLENNGLTRYKLISAINCKITKEQVKTEQKTGVIEFYKRSKSKFEPELIKGCPIITVGPALYSLLQEDDIYPNHCQQIIFGKSNFWFSRDLTSENGHYIYPIESFRDIFESKKVYDKTKKQNRDGSYPLKDTDILESIRDSFKTKLAQIQIKTVISIGNRPSVRYPKLKKYFITTKEDFYNVFYLPNKDKHDEVLAWDLETSGLNFLTDKIGCITLSFDGVTGYYINWKVMDDECKAQLNEILKNNKQCGANLKFDVKHLWRNGVPAAKIDEDVIQIGHTLDETRSNSLKALAFYYSEYGGYERPLDVYKAKLGKGVGIDYINDIPEDILKDYAVMDAIVTKRVWVNIMKHMRELDKKYPNEFYPNGMEQYYYNRRIPACQMYSKIEYTGCYVDKPRLDNLRVEMTEALKNIRRELSDKFDVPEDFDWGSEKKLGVLLEKKGWEDLGRSKSGEYATANFQLKRWAKTHPEAKKIREMRTIAVLLHSFVGDEGDQSIFNDFIREYTDEDYLDDDGEGDQGWSQYIIYHPEDNSYRMHATCGVHMNTTGRNRMSNPNLQNTPSHSADWGPKIKRCITTPNEEEYYQVTVDYQNLQMRLACIDCKDKNLTDMFNQPKADPHSTTGWLTFCANKEMDIETITVKDKDGVEHDYLGGESVFTEDRGNVFARELTEADGVIARKTEHRLITQDEFRRQKNSQPYKDLRSAAKGPNFLLIFGGSQKILADNALETTWNETQLDEYLKDNDCSQELEETKKFYRNEDPVAQKYIAAAARIRTNFFKGYPGLLERCDREVTYGEEHGYCRSVFGQTRNCIELMLQGEYDKRTISGVLRSESNQMKNVRMQNYESCVRGRAMFDTYTWLEKNGYKSRLWNDIHDSCDTYIYKPELHNVLAHMKHTFERVIPELRDGWVPLNIDCEIADLSDPNHHDYYKGGREPEEFGIEWKTLQFEDPDPFGVELAPEFEINYFRKRKAFWDNKNEKDPLQDKIEEYLKSKNLTI